ncbi:MAG TPA: NTP transferase domain-containing protein [Chitinophagaceae bacterium]|nr:NTP transferase domain-containing protein [Chitinophagaceae bacterium]
MTSKENKQPQLNGLVLAGGRSKRMGKDKGAIQWNGKEQRYSAADLLKKYCKEVYISCRQEQKNEILSEYQTLTDSFLDFGPYGGILSALRAERDKAWLVVACDLPLLDEETISYLIKNRNTDSIATTFESPHDGLPEPLITIWEPKSYPVLLDFLGKGYTCPRKVLINSNKTILQPPISHALMNVNTPEDARKAREILKV